MSFSWFLKTILNSHSKNKTNFEHKTCKFYNLKVIIGQTEYFCLILFVNFYECFEFLFSHTNFNVKIM